MSMEAACHQFVNPRNEFDSGLVISNSFIRDKNISLRAKGLLIYICGFGKEHKFSDKNICLDLSITKSALKKLISELKSLGYVKTLFIHGPGGKFSGLKRIVSNSPEFLS